jgi:mannonate dehydratase
MNERKVMIRVAAWCLDLSDSTLNRLVQLGVDAADGINLPTNDRGVYDLNEAVAIRKKVHSVGLRVNRVSLPDFTPGFMKADEGWERELDLAAESLEIMGQTGYPLVRLGFHHSTDDGVIRHYEQSHRGGYEMRGGSLAGADGMEPVPLEVRELRWQQVCRAYERLVPVAEEYDIGLMMHPSDPPTTDSLFGGLGFHRLLDAFPSPCVGYLYCVGTRAEAGGSSLVLDEINNYGRKGRIFEVHFRNVRASLPTAGAFEEVLLDDGDMNMFKILLALDQVGFDGCLNADHYPTLEGDDGSLGNPQALAYSVGYIKALLAALACV